MSKKIETITNEDVNSIILETTKKYLEYLNRQIKRSPDYVDFRIIEEDCISGLSLSSLKNDSHYLISHRFNLQNPETGEIRQKHIFYEIFPEFVTSFKKWFNENGKDEYFETTNIIKPIVDEYLSKKKQKINK